MTISEGKCPSDFFIPVYFIRAGERLSGRPNHNGKTIVTIYISITGRRRENEVSEDET